MPAPYIGRLAPSPTGYLHLGHAATFWTAYERARTVGGTLLFRNDDLDRHRSRPEFVAAMFEDLRWLGITWQGETVHQSERLPLYRESFERLAATGLVYACTCSRKDLQRLAQAPHEDDPDDEPIYDGRCRANVVRTITDDHMAYRLRVPDGETIAFTDHNLGPQQFVAGRAFGSPQQAFGDFVLWSRDCIPSYQLATVVDDDAMGIAEVVRGRDLLKSTARQMLLQRALGLTTPKYFHTELLRDANGRRLAKRHDALSLRKLRQQGVTPQEILRCIAQPI